jgi:hypothetical protein
MKAKQWNAAMFSAMVLISIIALPFFSNAFLDGGFGAFEDGGFGAFDDGGFGPFEDGGFGSSETGGFGATESGGFSGVPSPIPGYFDDNFQPVDEIPGNPAGPDYIVPTDGNELPPVVPPVIPPVVPTPSPSPSGSDDSLKIFIHNIFLHDPFSEAAGNQVPLKITFENTGTKDLDNTKVIVMIPDLSVRATIGPLDLNDGEKATGTVLLELPEDAELGVYPVRLQIYNEDAQRIVHREIEVVDYS